MLAAISSVYQSSMYSLWQRLRTTLCIGVTATLLSGTLYAQTAVIVNINAVSNGTGNPVPLSLAAGTYQISPIGTLSGGAFDAWNAWGTTSCSTTSGCPLNGNDTGWLHSFNISAPFLSSVTVGGVSLPPVTVLGAPSTTYFYQDNGLSSFNSGPSFIFPKPSLALAATTISTITLSQASTVTFTLLDTPYTDNLGGVSLSVALVPEPQTYALALLGLAILGLRVAGHRPTK